MKNIHLLPTQKPSKLHFDDKLFLSTNYLLSKGINSIVEGRNYKSFNIYITSDEEIKEGDWFLNDMNILFKAGKNYIENPAKEVYIGHKKIILTTDQDLIKDGVQAIDDEFLEWFVKNPSCDEIYVNKIESFDFGIDKYVYNYKIIIPKEKQEQVDNKESTLTPIENKLIEEAKKVWEESHPNPIEMALFGFNWREKQSKNKCSKKEVNKLLNTLLKNNMCSHAGDELIKKFKKK